MLTYQYAVRLDDREGYADTVSDLFQDSIRFPRVLVVKHKGKSGENIHYHMAVVSDRKQQAFRKELKKLFTKGKGNGHMSLKDWDGKKEYLTYMFHEEDAEVIYQRNFTEEELKTLREVGQDVKLAVKENSPTKICEIMAHRFRGSQPTAWDLKRAILDHCRAKGDWFPNRFQMDRWTMSIQCLLAEDQNDWEALRESWINSYYT